MAEGPRLTVYSRAYCHLCDDLLAALVPLAQRAGVAVEIVDVDSDAGLEAAYGDKVPVLMAGEREICHYHLDRAALDAYLAGIG
ncbi:MAG TPA: glutaredoxin family protein [Pelomicrobium sp.]|nr:glutaredoxin family protein [Pelomicrobium sp.]